MTPTVDDLRNEIRQAVGRHERNESTGFTKEALAAICVAVDYDVDTSGRFPPMSEMRAGILSSVGVPSDDQAEPDRPFRKAELEAIRDALDDE